MADFMIRFLICNVFISGIIGILLIAKRIFKGNLSSRMQYNLWFLLSWVADISLYTVPFNRISSNFLVARQPEKLSIIPILELLWEKPLGPIQPEM